ncbi:MAG TPA: hypothetical protein DEF30_09765 [Proteiniclasticum sp.]|uniref:hypothetical protein n=1 Tax=Proteiniclasticum sp. TaxID=2053595 RepID=UPI000E855CED|nr:hypothetical protein [Proteiniclasticum sp.]HBW14090.1 hypothetical protein [Proteiniclasticum sp.]
MKGLSYKKVFSKYSVSLSSNLSRVAYSSYKKVRIGVSKKFPLKEYERNSFEDHRFRDDTSTDMPLGFNFSTQENEDGYLNIEYIDFYDYLPKEDLDIFKKSIRKFVSKNKPAPFGPYRTVEDLDRIDNMGRYVDFGSFYNLYVVKLIRNEYLEKFSSQVAVSLMNLSASFLVVKYRFYITGNFNEKVNEICKRKHLSYTDVSRQFNIPWYKPQKFGRVKYTGDDARYKELYTLVSTLKWKAFSELKRYFRVYFEYNQLFPPTFDTYSTNIRPSSSRETREFWYSVMLGFHTDYAPKYNACVCWDYECSQYEGKRLSAYCGGNYTNTDHLPEIAKHDISDIYANYLTASSMRRIAERDIAICNRRISKAIRRAKTSQVLKVRVSVEKKLYYSYRFISEFTGDTIDHDDGMEFRSSFIKDGSTTSSCLKGIAKNTAETKKQIDNLLKILDDAAEYGSTKSNLSLQWFMMVVTVLSLIVAIAAIFDLELSDLKTLWNVFSDFMR